MVSSKSYDVSIVGGGIAGLSVALRLPENLSVALFTKGQLGESNTRYAQGGLTVALGADDSPELHFQDTIAAGAGLCDETGRSYSDTRGTGCCELAHFDGRAV